MAEARIIDGRAIAAELRRRVAAAAAQLGFTAGLATVLVGDDPAGAVYVRSKGRASTEVGIASFAHRLPGDASEAALLDLIGRLNGDDRVDGILVQLPLPPQIDAHHVLAALDPEKDVDGFHPVNVGRLWSGLDAPVPCTPQGVMRLIREVRPDLAGAAAVVLGRSNIVGKPTTALLLAAHATVTVAHSRSRELDRLCRSADILVAATGRPGLVGADWVKPGAVVIDVGISPVADADGGRLLAGDVDFAAVRRVAGALTPVPGGVGPMTIACLLGNTLCAACRRRGLAAPSV